MSIDGRRQILIALGSITNFFNLPGVQERALTMKTLGDAINLRNRLIAHLEEAHTEIPKSLACRSAACG